MSSNVMAPATTAGRQLFEDLRGAIETGRLRDGDRIAPIRELAAKYHIAFDTARATVGQLEKLALVRRRRGAGTFVTKHANDLGRATETRPMSTPTVALLIDSKAHLYDHLTADLVDLLQQHGLASMKLSWRLDQGIEQLDHLAKSWRAHPPRAVVVQSGIEKTDRQIDEICGGKAIIVCAFRGSSVPGRFSSVIPDYDLAYRVAAEELVERGHTRIGFVTNARNIRRENPWTLRKSRMEHTRQMMLIAEVLRSRGLNDHALTIHYNSVPNKTEVKRKQESGVPFDSTDVDRSVQWLRERKPTAVMGNDFRLLCVQRAADRLGLTVGRGGDLELMGIGNTPWSEALGIDSVSLREDLVARHVAKLITDQLEHSDEGAHHIVVAPKLIVRSRQDQPAS